jgi:hypothetical protein
MFCRYVRIRLFGCRLRGVALASQAESEDLRRRLAELPAHGFAAAVQRYFWLRGEVIQFSRIASHRRARPHARKAIWIGLAFFVAALISGQFAAYPR